jgi:hypothetical protein
MCLGVTIACEDGNACTEDLCVNGACAGAPLDTLECALDILIEHPPRAATLDGNPNVLVQGRVISPAGALASIRINGIETNVAADGSFDFPMESSVGLNPIEVRIRDVYDREKMHSQSYLHSSTLLTPGAPFAIVQIPNASNIWLARETFDDDNPSDLDDVTALGIRVMKSFDANSMLPHPIPECDSDEDFSDDSSICLFENPSFTWCSWSVDIENVDYDVKTVNILPVPDGLQLSAELDNFSGDHSLVAGGACPDCSGTIEVDTMSIEGTIPISITPQKNIALSVTGLEVEVDGLDVTCTDGLGSWFNWVIDWFEGTLEETFESMLAEFVPNNVLPMVQGVLDQILDYEIIFEVPSFSLNGTETTMHIKGSPQELELTTLGTEWVLNMGVASSAPMVNIGPGTIARNNCDGLEPQNNFWLPRKKNVEASLHEDLLNQMLYVLWQAGHLNLTVGDEVLVGANPMQISNLNLQLNPMLPPVLTTCAPGHNPELQLGDLHGTGTMKIVNNDVTLEFYASTRIRIEPVVDTLADGSSAIGFEIPEVSYMSIQIENVTGLGETTPESLEPFVSGLLVDFIGDGILGSLITSYPLPVIDVSSWIPSLPAGSNATFSADTITAIKGHTVVGGHVKEP